MRPHHRYRAHAKKNGPRHATFTVLRSERAHTGPHSRVQMRPESLGGEPTDAQQPSGTTSMTSVGADKNQRGEM